MGGLVHLAHLLWTHLLDQADYGRFAILEGVVFGFATATVTLAPQQYVLVYVHKKPRSELAGDLGGILSLAFAAGGLATLAVLALPDSFFVLGVEATPRWAIAGVIVAATFATGRMMAQSIHETQSQPTRAALWSDFVDGTRPFIAVALFFLLGWTWEARWGGLVVAQVGAGFAAVWVLSRQGWLGRPPSFASLREPLRYSLPMILAGLAYVGYQSADRLYVALWGGVAAAGRYEAAYRLALLVNTVNLVTLKSFTPLFYSAYGRGDREGAAKLLRKTSLQAAGWVALLIILLPLIAVYTPLLEESYRTSTSLVISIPILAAGLGCLGISFLWQAPLLARGKTKTVSAIAVTSAVVNLGADALLIPRMGEVGAAWGTLIAFVFMLSMTMLVAWRARE
ncbi:MAG: polysaccharide biosynthesis C-terminal domain-containing protein [Deltaproteobacteria bacterium]|jgi:O-antigen/teichoic acid export membrane protein|nr:polysaccharide biosynthesis C-terminal domain-containing protein [Deltaproteobacteria bacterium]MBW1904600.1 polysaccharide biosynthesis C-terminal domain-containing protein [Deltaproteobacteria bacterium]MBW2160430.1 polysaccharide biosynthesis C-terminal domain-containing protein [Deltaproteobacteria bacterium]MBW2375557.1 polysaccharide biosynthesis C-terminal domain-containing protein [Deltaproteobacteria bacterium]MBW2587070.1 polysaccharide biosynthesis C-terminal domain-containing pro